MYDSDTEINRVSVFSERIWPRVLIHVKRKWALLITKCIINLPWLPINYVSFLPLFLKIRGFITLFFHVQDASTRRQLGKT